MTAEELGADILAMTRRLENGGKVTAVSSDAELRLARAVLAARWMIGILYQLLSEHERTSIRCSDIFDARMGCRERRFCAWDFTESRQQIKATIDAIDAELARRAQQPAAHERSHA